MTEETNEPTTESLLTAAITAAKGKQPAEAQALLKRVLSRDPNNVNAWLWMSGVTTDPLIQEACLRKVLELDPEHPTARRGLARVQQTVATQRLAQGIRAAEQGKNAQAHKLLTDVVMRDEQNLDAWLWLSRVVESDQDREVCYDNVLTLDAENEEALVGLALIEQNRRQATGEWQADDVEEDRERAASTLAGDILGEPYREKHTTVIPEPEPEPEAPSQALWAKYDEPNRCPYCAGKTTPEDRRCPSCRNRLWIASRAKTDRSALLWLLIALQAASTALAAAGPFMAVLLAAYQAGISNTTQLLAAYLGRSHTLSPATLASAQEVLPPLVFWLLWIPILYGLIMTIGLYLRWRVIFYGMCISAVFMLASAIAGITLGGGNLLALAGSLVGVGIAIANVLIVIKLQDDFTTQNMHLLLDLDPGLKTGVDYLMRGRVYIKRKAWAKAAIHFRRAAALMPTHVDGLHGIAYACDKLGDEPLAEWALETALERMPDNPQTQALLKALRADGETR